MSIWPAYALWNLYDLMQSYSQIFRIALELQRLRSATEYLKGSEPTSWDAKAFQGLLEIIEQQCLAHGFTHTSEMAKRAMGRPPETNRDINSELIHLNDSLDSELAKESLFRIPHERKQYFEQNDLFGPNISTAFPSCARDIQRAGSCYALGQEDACVHHLMLVLERGLSALAKKVGVLYDRINWQNILNEIASRLNSLPRGPERDFYNEATAQFGFLKVAYRNHSEHARDDPYDLEKALSILTHVRAFMQTLEKGGLSE